MKCYIIGDIHGCLEELASLIEALPLRPADRLVFLGDYVDRGPDSRGVVSYLIDLRRKGDQEAIFIKGNHEDMFLSYLGFPGHHGDMFLLNGGDATLTSYGISWRNEVGREIRSMIPNSHIEFFQGLRSSYLMDPFFCVHAGIHPLKSLDDQVEEEMFWIRDEFIQDRHILPYTVLFGHTPMKEVFFDLPYKIGLDTGLVYGNTLSCFEIFEKVLFQIKRGKKRVTQEDVGCQWQRLPSSPVP
jgi:serine/threonine protein phosphatase 1